MEWIEGKDWKEEGLGDLSLWPSYKLSILGSVEGFRE